MPQTDLYYSDDQSPDASLLAEIETIFREIDGSTGESKGRAHRVATYHHSHMFLRVSMLPKAHRDAAFADKLGQRLADALKHHAKAPCEINVQIRFDLEHYTTLTLS